MTSIPDALRYYISDITPSPERDMPMDPIHSKIPHPAADAREVERNTKDKKKRSKGRPGTLPHLASVAPRSASRSRDGTSKTRSPRSNEFMATRVSRLSSTRMSKESMKTAIWRLLPSEQPGLYPVDIQHQLEAQSPEISNGKSSNGFRATLSITLLQMLRSGDIGRENAPGPKGGKSHRYIAKRQDHTMSSLPALVDPEAVNKAFQDVPEMQASRDSWVPNTSSRKPGRFTRVAPGGSRISGKIASRKVSSPTSRSQTRVSPRAHSPHSHVMTRLDEQERGLNVVSTAVQRLREQLFTLQHWPEEIRTSS